MIALVVDLCRVSVYLGTGLAEDPGVYRLLPFLFGVAWLGALGGKRALKALRPESFRKLLLVILFAVGLYLLLG